MTAMVHNMSVSPFASTRQTNVVESRFRREKRLSRKTPKARRFCTQTREIQMMKHESSLEHLHNSVPNRVAREICDRMQSKFPHEIRAVGLRCFDAEIQCNGDFFAGLTLGE
jgi:hypothetical protein